MPEKYYNAPRASSTQAEQLQRNWLEKAKRNKAPDILEYARQQGERLHDEIIRKTARQLDPIIIKPDDPNPLKELYHFGAEHRSDSNPVWLALAGFIQTTGPHRSRLEHIAMEYLCDEHRLRQRAERETGTAKHDLLHQAQNERLKGINLLHKSRANQNSGITLHSRKMPHSNAAVPISLKRLNQLADRYHKDLQQWASQQASSKRRRKAVPAPRPAIQFDQKTLLEYCRQSDPETKSLPQALRPLTLDTDSETRLQEEAHAALEKAQADLAQHTWDTAAQHAQDLQRILLGDFGPKHLPHTDRDTSKHYDRTVLEKLAHTLTGSKELPDHFELVLSGKAGKAARKATVEQGTANRRQEQTDLEDQHNLSRAERVHRRSHLHYDGPPLDWNMATLQEIWLNEGTAGRMPRHWYKAIPKFTTPALADAIQREQSAEASHTSAVERLDEAHATKKTKGTLSTRRKAVRETLADLMAAIAETNVQFEKAGVRPPPDPAPHLAQPEEQKQPEPGQMTLPIPQVVILEKRKPKRNKIQPPRPTNRPEDLMNPLL